MPNDNEIEWVEADSQHEAALNRFVCADPDKMLWTRYRGKHHPRIWELQVQSGFRGLHLPRPRDEGLLLALIGDEIVAACWFSLDLDGEQLLIRGIGVHVNYRRRGIGAEMLDKVLYILEDNRSRLEMDCGFWANIHPANEPSQALFASRGFVNLDQGSSELQSWLKAPGLESEDSNDSIEVTLP